MTKKTTSKKNDLVSFIFNSNETNAALKWSDGSSTTVEMKRIGDEYCIYKGKFEEDPDSVVMFTGCQSKNILIQSLVFGNTWGTTMNGSTTVEVIQDTGVIDEDSVVENTDFIKEFGNRSGRSVLQDKRTKREIVDKIVHNPNFKDEFPSTYLYTISINFPPKLHLDINVYLSTVWRSNLQGRSDEVAKEVVALASQILQDNSLQTKIILKPNYITYKQDHDDLDDWMNNVPIQYLKKGTAQMLLTYSNSNTVGIAMAASICSDEAR